MKKILLLSLFGLCAGSLKAQTELFNQPFGTDASDNTAVTAAYVRTNATEPQISINDNMFTKLGPTSNYTVNNVSVTGGKLRLVRTGAFASANSGDYTLAASRTVSGAGGNNTNARLALNGPQVMKISMTLTLSNFAAYSATHNNTGGAAAVNGMTNAVLLFVGGDAMNQYGSDNPAGNANFHSVLGISTSPDGALFRFSNPQGFGSAGSGADINFTTQYSNGATVSLAWYINNSGSSMTYTDPNGATQTLEHGNWDLYTKLDTSPTYVHLLVNRKSKGTATAINNMALQVRPLNGYTANTQTAQTWVPNPLTVEIANWKAEDITGSVTLPVTLTSFAARTTGNAVKLNWETAGEQNNSHFAVEASVNGKDFKEIGTVLSKARDGNSNIPLQYEFSLSKGSASLAAIAFLTCFLPFGRRFGKRMIIIAALVSGTVFIACNKSGDTVNTSSDNLYFRIGWVDKDGGIKYSKIVKAIEE